MQLTNGNKKLSEMINSLTPFYIKTYKTSRKEKENQHILFPHIQFYVRVENIVSFVSNSVW